MIYIFAGSIYCTLGYLFPKNFSFNQTINESSRWIDKANVVGLFDDPIQIQTDQSIKKIIFINRFFLR